MRVLTRKAKAGGNPVRSNMLRDITLGQYYQTESVIHKMDPRVKLGGTLLFIISLFFFKNYAGYVIAALFLGLVIRLSKVPFKFMVKGMKTIVMLMLITVVFNLFLTPGTPLFTIWKLTITQEGLKMAISMAIRLTLLIIGSSVMTLTTTPNNLTDGMEKMMGPLKVFKVPVHEVAMMMSIALRFIPILLEETDKIMKAQIARGADFESGNIFKRAKAMVPLLVPLFISAFRRANDLAMAMEARCYRGGEGRTKMKPLIYHKRDYIAYGCIAAYMVISIVVGRLPFLP
jgi:ABC transporter permease protein